MTVTDKMYSALASDARVVAVIAAMARRDDAETTRLMDTAPLASYRAHDLEFWRLLHCAERMALHTALLIEPETMRYTAALGALIHFARAEEGEFTPDEAESLLQSIAKIGARIKAYWLAYTTTCADIGLDPDELLRGVGAELSDHASILTRKEVGPDAELLASATDLMRQLSGR